MTRFLDRISLFMATHLGGHVNIGPITIYGENAMHWAVNIKLKTGWLAFRLPFLCFGRWWGLYMYFSPNATPDQAKWIIGNRP